MLRKQLVEYLRQSRGVLCNESQILITGGLQHSLELVCKLFNGTVAMEEPGYDGALTVFHNNNIPVYPIRIDDQGIIVSHLRKIEKDISFAYITPSHQFPTGVTMTIRRRYELLDWAKSSDSYIFEDDYDSEYRYNTNPIPALQSIDRDDRVIYFGTFSKSLSPSTRIAFVVLPNRLMAGYYDKLQMYHCVVPWINQYIVSKLIENKHYSRHIRKLCLIFRKRHDLLLAELKKMSDKITVQNPGAGLYLIVNFPQSITCDWLIEKAAEQGVKVYSTARFWQDKLLVPPNTLFLGFSLIELDNIPDCISRLKKAWFDE